MENVKSKSNVSKMSFNVCTRARHGQPMYTTLAIVYLSLQTDPFKVICL